MGKASSAKKVARAARAGGNRRSGQRRALGFPIMIAAVLLLGLGLVVSARADRSRNAAPRVNAGAAGVTGDHWHEPYSIYTCVADTGSGAASSSESSSSASSSSDAPTDATPTTAPTSTTIAAEGDVPGAYREFLKDASEDVLGIHTHGDGVAHIHPFASSVSGRRATLDKLLAQTGATMTDDTLSIPNPTTGSTDTFREGETKCQGGKDGVLKVARWDNAQDAASGKKPNEIFTSGFGSIRLRNGQVLSITFLPEGSTLPVQSDVATRLGQLSDVAPSTVETNPAASSSSGSPAESSSPGATSSPASSESPASSSS